MFRRRFSRGRYGRRYVRRGSYRMARRAPRRRSYRSRYPIMGYRL